MNDRKRAKSIWFAFVKGKVIRAENKTDLKKTLVRYNQKDIALVVRGQEYDVTKVTDIQLVAPIHKGV